MRKNFTKALLLTLGLGVAVTLTSCHSSSDESVAEVTKTIAPTHTIRGTILDGNGNPVNGVAVTLSRQGTASKRVVDVTGNTFEVSGLSDGTWDVVVTKNGYKDLTESIALAVRTETIGNESVRVGHTVNQVFYIFEETKSKSIKLGGEAQSTDEIVIETSTQDDGTGNIVNTTDPSGDQTTAYTITVDAATPAISGDAYDDVENQLKAQGGSIEDFQMSLININSLEDAKKLAQDNGISASRDLTRATTSLPGGREMLAGVGIDAGPFKVELTGTDAFELTITLPDENTKNAITLFRTISGNTWTALTTGDGITAVDRSQPNKIVIRMNTIQTQSIAMGLNIVETSGNATFQNITAASIENNSNSSRSISSMPYTMMEGVVLTNTIQGPLTDLLRKIVLRLYGVKAVNTPKAVTAIYNFSPAFTLPAGGTLNLAGIQRILHKTYSVRDGSAAFTTQEYDATYVYPWATYPETEATHVAGSN